MEKLRKREVAEKGDGCGGRGDGEKRRRARGKSVSGRTKGQNKLIKNM
jgi:hypothetical protein